MLSHAASTSVTKWRGNYIVSAFGHKIELKRDIHFNILPGTRKPSLYKAGAEKMIWLYSVTANDIAETQAKQVMLDSACLLRELCDVFCQDAEHIAATQNAYEQTKEENGNNLINARQARCLFLIGKTAGMPSDEVRNVLLTAGFNSARMVTQADYDKVCAILQAAH